MRYLYIFIALLLTIPLMAQTVTTPSLCDSTGTATTYWQKIDLKRGLSGSNVPAVGNSEVINRETTGTAYLSVATTYQDTAHAATWKGLYQKRVYANDKCQIPNTGIRYFYVKASTGTIVYSVGTY